jgi:hypothetical protein
MLEHTRGYKYYGERGRKGAKAFFTFLPLKAPFYRFSLRYYYKTVTFLPFKLKSINFCLRTFAIPDIFPNFAPTFLTDEIIVKIQW